jgi:hypothetical protein
MLEVILVLNAIWFLMAFNVFAIRNKVFAKLLVQREYRDTPVFSILAESGKFLGGFNLAFAVLSILLLMNVDIFPTDMQRTILLFTIAVAHGTQFVFNIPVAIANRRGGGAWQVKGTMLFIFATDFIMMSLNLALAVIYFIK